MLSLMLAMGIVSRLISGWISDHIGGLKTLLLGSVLQGVAHALHVLAHGAQEQFARGRAFARGEVLATMRLRRPILHRPIDGARAAKCGETAKAPHCTGPKSGAPCAFRDEARKCDVFH